MSTAHLNLGTLTDVTKMVEVTYTDVGKELATAEFRYKITSENLGIIDVEEDDDTKQTASASTATCNVIYAEQETAKICEATKKILEYISGLLPLAKTANDNSNKTLGAVKSLVNGNQLIKDAELGVNYIETVLKMMEVALGTIKDVLGRAEANQKYAHQHFPLVILNLTDDEDRGHQAYCY
jgi:hypothetical protein